MKSQKLKKIKVFIGYDANETIAYHTCVQSIIDNSSLPVEFFPLKLNLFKKFYKRKKRKVDSTEFSISRFLVPYLSDFKGFSVYVDCDFIFLEDIARLFQNINNNKALWCVKHNYTARNKQKFLGNIQYKYQRKNWSSLMVFNNKKCKVLTPNYVENANGLFLHQFKWLKDQEISAIDKKWNVLIGEQAIPKKPKAIHYTVGGPYFKHHRNTKMASTWNFYFKKVIHPKN